MNKKKIKLIIVCIIVAMLLLSLVWIYVPSEGKVIFLVPDADIKIEDSLSYAETVKVKKILWGKIRWPESLYGYPACGFGDSYSIVIDGTMYMPSWDSCGMLGVKDVSSDDSCTYINVSLEQIKILEEIIESRNTQ